MNRAKISPVTIDVFTVYLSGVELRVQFILRKWEQLVLVLLVSSAGKIARRTMLSSLHIFC